MLRKTKLLVGLAAVSTLVLALGVAVWQRSHGDDAAGAIRAQAAPLPSAKPASLPPSPDGIPLAGFHAQAVRTPSAPGAWGGPRTGKEATLSDRVVDYKIAVKLDTEKHTMEGQQQLTWRNRSDREVKAVYLHLYLNAFESEGSTFMTEQRRGFGFRSEVDVEDGNWGYTQLKRVEQGGKAVPWHFIQPDGGPETDHTVVRLDLPQGVAAGASTTLDIDFFNQLPRVIARTGYFGSFHLVGQWFPKMAVLELPGERGATEPRWNAHEFHLHSEFYADFGHFDVQISVPKGVTVGSTGELTGAPVERDGWVTHRYVQGDVHDFAFTADSRTAPPLEAKWTGPGSPEVSVRVLFPPEYAHNAPRVLKATLDSLSYFSKTLGPYPYKTVTAVIPPFNAEEAGGMEYPTFFTASSYADDEEGTMNAYQLDFVTIHEFGHGYFYGILASNEFEEPMLDEGLNEFWNLRMIRERGQAIPARTLNSKRLGLGSDVPAFDFERSFSVVGEPADPLGQNSWNRHSSASYGSVYGRTATALRDLESVLGKEVLEKAFMAYYERWKFRHPTVADLQAVLAEVSGEPAAVAGLFERHIYAAQKIDDRVDKLVSEEVLPLKGQILAEGKRTERDTEAFDALVEKTRKDWDQAHPDAAPGTGPYPWRSTVVLRRYGAAVPQTVRVTFEDGSVELAVWDNQDRWQQFSWVKASKVVSAELDPTYAHAMDTRWLDNSRSLKADRAAARRWSLEGASLFQTLFALVSTL